MDNVIHLGSAPTPRGRTARLERRTGQLNVFEEAPTVHHLSEISPFSRGVTCVRRGDAAGAETAFRSAVRAGVRVVDASIHLAVLNWHQDAAVEAIDLLLSILDVDLVGNAHYTLGLMLTDLGEYHGAYAMLRRSEQAGMTGPDLYAALAEVAEGTGREVEATQARLRYEGLTGQSCSTPAAFVLPA